MDEIKHLTNRHSFLQLSAVLHKLVKAIRANKSLAKSAGKSSGAGRFESAAVCKESEFLKLQCLSENGQLSQLAFQTFGRLVEEGTLEAAVVMSMLVSMVPGAGRTQLVALSEAVINLLLLDLKRRDAQYVCPFGLQTPQHPLIAFFQKTETNVVDLVGKINGLSRHHDREIRRHSCEFLRPVFLFVFCNPIRFPDTSPLWIELLEQSKSNAQARDLLIEVLSWSNISSDVMLLQTSCMLIDTIARYQADATLAPTTCELCLYLGNMLPELIAYGYDPRPALSAVSEALHQTAVTDAIGPYLNTLLISLCHSLSAISPVYLTDMCRLLRHLCLTLLAGNAVSLRMLLSELINWIASPQLLREDCVSHLQALVRHVTGGKWRHQQQQHPGTPNDMRAKYFHPAIAFSVDLAVHSEHLCLQLVNNRQPSFVQFDNLYSVRPQLCIKITSYLRALFLLEMDASGSGAIADTLLLCVRNNSDACIAAFMTWLYRTLHETDARHLIGLLRGLTAFGAVKENIPKIISALKSLGQAMSGQLRPMILELYLSLWRCEDRTFVYLKNELSAATKSIAADGGSWELNVARARTIQEICQLKPAKHGAELIVHLSNILNTCTTSDGETATVIALQTIVGLCTSQTINIASTWSALRELFKAEHRIRPLIVQCEFYGQVPLLVSPTAEYEACLDDALSTLWTMIATSGQQPEVKVAALNALRNFDYQTLSLAHVPSSFHPKLSPLAAKSATVSTAAAAIKPSADDNDEPPPPPPITGDFWPHLLQMCANEQVASSASALINHYIAGELRTFRQHMYVLAEGHIEPLNYNRLPGSDKSPLRSMVRALLLETNKPPYARDQHCIRYALRTLSAGLPRPMPPLNWFFLVELMNADAAASESQHMCRRIVANQQLHSESARQIVENYFAGLQLDNADDIDYEELHECIRLFATAGRGLSAATVRHWLPAVAKVAFTRGQQVGFGKDGAFALLLDSCGQLFAFGSDAGFGESNENYAIVVNELSVYYGRFASDSLMVQKYCELMFYLPEPIVDILTLPMGWSVLKSSEQWQKVLLVRQRLVTGSLVKKSLRWLNPSVENITSEFQPLLQSSVEAALGVSRDERDACVWAMDLLCMIQAHLTTAQPVDNHYVAWRLRLFCCAVIVRAGFDRFSARESTGCLNDDWLVRLFPEALLHAVAVLDIWRDNETRIYEFFFNVYQNASDVLPAAYLRLIRNVFVCARSRPYFLNASVWKKFVGLRK